MYKIESNSKMYNYILLAGSQPFIMRNVNLKANPLPFHLKLFVPEKIHFLTSNISGQLRMLFSQTFTPTFIILCLKISS